VLFLVAFWPYIRNKKMFADCHTRHITILFLLNVFALGSIGDPLPFIFFALAYRSLHPPTPKMVEGELTLPQS